MKNSTIYFLSLLVGISFFSCQNIFGLTDYISGERFRSCADFVLDEHLSFDPAKVFNKALIFVQGSIDISNKTLNKFFEKYHPKINARYILITHDSHQLVPGKFKGFLDDPKIIAWFGKNMASDHPKAFGLPIGFANSKWPHGNVGIINQCIKIYQNGGSKKSKLAYMNFDINTFIKERREVWNLFAHKSFCTVGKKKSFKSFLGDIATSMFVISPRGSGYDCHRTWEALYMGSYPIVKKSPIDKIYDELPVIIVNDWSEVTEDFLHKKYEEFSKKEFNYEKLNFQYWISLIKSFTK